MKEYIRSWERISKEIRAARPELLDPKNRNKGVLVLLIESLLSQYPDGRVEVPRSKYGAYLVPIEDFIIYGDKIVERVHNYPLKGNDEKDIDKLKSWRIKHFGTHGLQRLVFGGGIFMMILGLLGRLVLPASVHIIMILGFAMILILGAALLWKTV